jgi:hypothetical protein
MTISTFTTAPDAPETFNPPISVSELGARLGLDLSDFPFNLSISSLDKTNGIRCTALLEIEASGTTIQITLKIDKSQKPPTYALGVGDLALSLRQGSDPAVYAATLNAGSRVSLATLFDLLGVEADGSLVSEVGITSLFMAAHPAGTKGYLFGLELDLSSLNATVDSPLLSFATGSSSVSLVGGTFLAANTPWAADQLTSVAGVVEQKLPSRVASGPNAAVTLKMGDKSVLVPLTPSGQAPAQSGGKSVALARLDAAGREEADGGAPPKVHWLNVQKEVGPLSVERVGFAAYGGHRVGVLCDAKLTLGPLVFSLDGFTVELTLSSSPDVGVSLEGIDLAFNNPPLVIDGGFLHTEQNGSDLYVGEAMIESPSLGLAALGEYAEHQGNKSLALFAALTDPPLGGPGFFYVKGLALGFGYNNQLAIPTTIADLDDFYLLQVVAGTAKPSLDTIAKQVQPAAGEDWIAIGLGLKSFELLQATALLTAIFGHDLQFAILGQAEISIPPDSQERIAYAQIDVEATYSPLKGALEVFGGLTKSSFVFSPDCHLSGGFAYVLATSGDFVTTFGGYALKFDHASRGYPAVDRLEMSWKVDSHTSIKGDAYFALTPAAMMAGGSLQATWDADIFAASFTADVDLLMQWRPFQYAASFAMSLSVRFQLKVAFVHIHYNFHVGASLKVAGPPFHGTAHIHLPVISFTINFGGSPGALSPLTWTQFRALLPGSSTDDGTNSSLLTAKVTAGLITDLTQGKGASDPDWVIRGTDFNIAIQSSIPVTQASSGQDVSVKLTPVTPPIGILPMGIRSAQGTLDVKLSGSKGNVVSAGTDPTSQVVVEALQGSMAAAHWGTAPPSDANAATQTGTCGYRLSGGRPNPDHTKQISVTPLLSQFVPISALSDRPALAQPFG